MSAHTDTCPDCQMVEQLAKHLGLPLPPAKTRRIRLDLTGPEAVELVETLLLIQETTVPSEAFNSMKSKVGVSCLNAALAIPDPAQFAENMDIAKEALTAAMDIAKTALTAALESFSDFEKAERKAFESDEFAAGFNAAVGIIVEIRDGLAKIA